MWDSAVPLYWPPAANHNHNRPSKGVAEKKYDQMGWLHQRSQVIDEGSFPDDRKGAYG